MRSKVVNTKSPNDFVTCPGDRYHVTFSPKVMKDGTVLLVESGKEDIQQYIDSFRETTDIAYMIKRLQMGDTSVLSSKVPFFGDFSSVPNSYADALQMFIDAENKFKKLPLDVRNSFDNDFHKWMASSGSEDWIKKMSSLLPQSDDVIPESSSNNDKEVNSNES